jgi:hypothetical protein
MPEATRTPTTPDEHRDYRTEEQVRLDTILGETERRDRKWLRQLVSTEAGASLLLGRI